MRSTNFEGFFFIWFLSKDEGFGLDLVLGLNGCLIQGRFLSTGI